MDRMAFEDFVTSFMPDASVEEDNDGQLVVYTNLTVQNVVVHMDPAHEGAEVFTAERTI